MSHFKCEICGNSDERFIGYKNGKPYCRKCVLFQGEEAKKHCFDAGSVVLDLKYSLSNKQRQISDRIIENYKNGIDTLVNAVCGAGKTELVFGVISYALAIKQTVAFAIPRRDVVIELSKRLKQSFPYNIVTAVYGGSTDKLEGDIVVLTTHQLFRYKNYFDLIVLDEIDAFPYKDSDVLKMLFSKSIKGHHVLMSATPNYLILNEYNKKGREVLELNVRFHRHPLPVPVELISTPKKKVYECVYRLEKFVKSGKPVLIFAPTIKMCNDLFKVLNAYVRGGANVHSLKEGREKIIEGFRGGVYRYLVTTSVLERGVTIKNLQVIIYSSDHDIYDEYALVQIAGRVGRKYDAPEGEVLFIAEKRTISMERAIRNIREKNKSL